jgi:hypothetical protein
VVAALAITSAYVLLSLGIVFVLVFAVCDPSEQDCESHWNAARIGRWAAWVALGVGVAALMRHVVRRTENRASWAGAIGVVGGFALAALVVYAGVLG